MRSRHDEPEPWGAFRRGSIQLGINEMSSNLQTTRIKTLEMPPCNLCLVASFFPATPADPLPLIRGSSENSLWEVGRTPPSAQDAHIRLYKLHGKPGDIFISGGERDPAHQGFVGQGHFVSQKAIRARCRSDNGFVISPVIHPASFRKDTSFRNEWSHKIPRVI